MKKLAVAVTSLALVAFLGVELAATSAFAANKKVPCDQIMTELNGGKKVAEVAKDLGTTAGHVRYCRRKAKLAERAEKEKAEKEKSAASGEAAPAGSPAASPGAAK